MAVMIAFNPRLIAYRLSTGLGRRRVMAIDTQRKVHIAEYKTTLDVPSASTVATVWPDRQDHYAVLAQNMHQPSGLTRPSTILQVLVSARNCWQLLHFCSPLGRSWYFACALGTVPLT